MMIYNSFYIKRLRIGALPSIIVDFCEIDFLTYIYLIFALFFAIVFIIIWRK